MANPAEVPLVELRDISIAFGGIKAVDHVTVDLYPGEVVGLLGHNGAGKSPLITILSGAYPAEGGEIWNNGDKAEDNGRIVVRTWDRIEANARTGVRDKTIFGTWKINTLVSGGNHHRNLRHGKDVTEEEPMQSLWL